MRLARMLFGLSLVAMAGSAAVLAAHAGRSPAPSPAPSATRPAPIHVDAADLERAMLDADKAFLYGDGAAARKALDRAEKDCRRLSPDDVPAWPRAMIDQDGGMHMALDRAREYAARGRIEDAIGAMVWAMRACRNCHALRDKGTTTPAEPR